MLRFPSAPYRLLLALALGLGGLVPVQAQHLRLNEIVASNHSTLADEDGEYPDWIELYNAGSTALSLAGYGLSDDPDEPFRFVLPDRTLAPGTHTLVFASGKDRPGTADTYPHASFRLDADGESLTLTAPNGTRIDEVTFEALPPNVAYGRAPDGADAWAFFDAPTPNTPNPSSGAVEIAPLPTASHPGGRYDGPVTVTLSAPGDDAALHYTLDGSPPTQASPRYAEPLRFDETTPLRARVFGPDYLPGPVLTNTYLIDEDVSLPVIALSTPPANLWDEETGIYVLGPRDYSPQLPHYGANFWEDWEIPVHVELFEPDDHGTSYELDAGTRIYGGWTRSFPQKSLAIFSRNRYGVEAIRYRLFPNRAFDEYQAFVLRNSGNDWYNTHFRDGLMQSLVEDLDLDVLAYRPAVVFLNGEYWGIQNIREKINEHYVASHHGVDPNAIDMLEGVSHPPPVIHGSRAHYMQFLDHLDQQDMTSEEVFAVVEGMIDVDNFIDYQIVQIFYANTDWPANNNKFWRPQTPEGRWRWILYDTDFGFGLYNPCEYGEESRQEGRPAVPCTYHETLDYATYPDGTEWPNPAYSTFVLRRLLENPAFRNAFINRFADHLNHTFTTERMLARIEAMQQAIAPEIARHKQRWDQAPNSWGNHVERLREFARHRTDFMWTHLRDFFALPDTTSITLTSEPAGAGTLRLNRLDVEGDAWTGRYFPGVPVELHARPRPGYRFAGWSGDVESSDPQLAVDPATVSTVTAHFEVNPDDPRGIVLNEVLYQPSPEADSGDWVEFTNLHETLLDVSGWTFRDDDDSHAFVLPSGTEIEAGGYLILCRDPEAFAEVYEQACLGGWNFGLSSGGDMLRLYDAGGALVDSVRYENAAPWPTVVDGSGHTLELTDGMLDNSDPEHWRRSQQPGGTPGALNSTATPGAPAPKPPAQFALGTNYPNPFRDATSIAYELPRDGRVVLRVYDVLGRAVRTLVDARQAAGTYTVRFEARGLAGGVYFYRLETEQGMQTRSMLLVK